MSSRLPGYTLRAQLGAGGMGTVWSAVHEDSGTEVAIKFILRADAPRARQAFRREIRAIAAMDHPGILRVYDQGTCDSGPFLVMERAKGPVHFHPMPLRTLLLSALDALAHTHARGMLHLDIKASNLLVGLDGRLRLADFGVAVLRGDHERGLRGSMPYMATEQLWGEGWKYGPWTDLFALGCLAYQLLLNVDPFPPEQPLDAHRSARHSPPLIPENMATSGFVGWVRRLMDPDPRKRFQRAADAAHALQRLPSPITTSSISERDTAQTLLTEDSVLPTPLSFVLTSSPEPTASADAPLAALPVSPMVAAEPVVAQIHSGGWRRPFWRQPTPPVGLGLGLFGLRRLPVIGREAVQDQLWEALRAVQTSARPQLVVLSGQPGVGKSHLAGWLCERAEESGQALTLTARYSADQRPQLRDALRRTLGNAQDETRLSWWFPDAPRLVSALKSLMTEENLSAEQSQRLLRRTREALLTRSNGRAVIVWLDDAHWGAEALHFARLVLASRQGGPILLVMTVREDILAETPDVSQMVERLLNHPHATRITIDVLNRIAQHQLLQDALYLSNTLIADIIDRTSGSPLFAVELVQDWIQRGLLTVGSDGGFQLAGPAPNLPDDLHAVWLSRLERVFDGPNDRIALERAAVLGVTVNAGEWQRLCADVSDQRDPRFTETLAERLQEDALATPEADGWRFRHGMLRASLLRSAQEHQRLQAHHRLCAALLTPTGTDWRMFVRRGLHFAEAGLLDDAWEDLHTGLTHARGVVTFEENRRIVAHAQRVLNRRDPPAADVRWYWLKLRRATLLYNQNQLSAVLPLITESLEYAERHKDHTLLINALHQNMMLCLSQKRGEEGLAFTKRYQQESIRNGVEKNRTWTRIFIAQFSTQLGRREDAIRALEEAALLPAEEQGMSQLRGTALGWIAKCWMDLGKHDKAIALYRLCIEEHLRQGSMEGAANIYNHLGDLSQMRGDLAEAEQQYTRCLALSEPGSLGAIAAQINQSRLLLLRHQWQQAVSLLDALSGTLERLNNEGWSVLVYLRTAHGLLGLNERSRVDALLDKAEHTLHVSGFVEREVAEDAQSLAAIAPPDMKRRALIIARDQYRALRDEDNLNTVNATLTEITTGLPT